MTTLKEQARRRVSMALERGALTRPQECGRCGRGGATSDGRAFVQAHHHQGYEKPLDVEWLCPRCHCREDPRLSRGENGNAKLTESEVATIREEYRPGATWKMPEGGKRWLGRKYGVNQRTIDRIVRGKSWIEAALDG